MAASGFFFAFGATLFFTLFNLISDAFNALSEKQNKPKEEVTP